MVKYTNSTPPYIFLGVELAILYATAPLTRRADVARSLGLAPSAATRFSAYATPSVGMVPYTTLQGNAHIYIYL